jgi:Carboxypeptidase regulatory-like domain
LIPGANLSANLLSYLQIPYFTLMPSLGVYSYTAIVFGLRTKLLLAVLCSATGGLRAQSILNPAPAGALRGVTRDSNGKPMAEVRVTAHSVTEDTDRTVVSGADGTFSMDGLKPGQYQVTAKADGSASAAATTVNVTGRDPASVDLPLAKDVAPASVSAAAKPGFFKRFGQAYWSDWHPATEAANTVAPAYRGYPPPVSNPPFLLTFGPLEGLLGSAIRMPHSIP